MVFVCLLPSLPLPARHRTRTSTLVAAKVHNERVFFLSHGRRSLRVPVVGSTERWLNATDRPLSGDGGV